MIGTPNIDRCKVLSAPSRVELEREIDQLLAANTAFLDVPLILPASETATRSSYRGISVRQWDSKTGPRFDACVDLNQVKSNG